MWWGFLLEKKMDAAAYRDIDKRLAFLEQENRRLHGMIQGHDLGTIFGRYMSIGALRGFWPMAGT